MKLSSFCSPPPYFTTLCCSPAWKMWKTPGALPTPSRKACPDSSRYIRLTRSLCRISSTGKIMYMPLRWTSRRKNGARLKRCMTPLTAAGPSRLPLSPPACLSSHIICAKFPTRWCTISNTKTRCMTWSSIWLSMS